jgi:hypothetical protein
VFIVSLSRVAAVVVAMVHEDVHQRARQQKCERQDAQYMGAMFGEQKETADCRDDEQHNAPA